MHFYCFYYFGGATTPDITTTTARTPPIAAAIGADIALGKAHNHRRLDLVLLLDRFYLWHVRCTIACGAMHVAPCVGLRNSSKWRASEYD